MGGETGNTSEMARKLAVNLFKVFGWRDAGAHDQNWKCVTPSHKLKNHPSDVVFYYDDPYESKRIYVNADLKSYARGSITDAKVKEALTSLAKATECANKADEFQKLYSHEDHNKKVVGMLFIYNHDDDYDDDFSKILIDTRSANISLKKGSRLFVIGPKDVTYLSAVETDILAESTRRHLSALDQCRFYYPELILARTQTNFSRVATLETLTGPWQVFHFATSESGDGPGGYFIYYSGKGDSHDDFKYIIDLIFRYELIRDNRTIEIRLPFATNEAASNFHKAKESYTEDFWGFEGYGRTEFNKRLEKITFVPLGKIVNKFSGVAIGMERQNATI